MSLDSVTAGRWAVSTIVPAQIVSHQENEQLVVSLARVTPRRWPDGRVAHDEETLANARLIAAAKDHALVGWAMCASAGRWVAWGDGRGEFALNGLRFATRLDEFGIPGVTEPLRAHILQTRGAAAEAVA